MNIYLFGHYRWNSEIRNDTIIANVQSVFGIDDWVAD